jgi:signal transduction histidine kinase
MKSNRKTGRDGIREQKERKIKLRAPKPVSSKNVAPVANKSGKVVNSPVSIQELVKKLEIVKNCIKIIHIPENITVTIKKKLPILTTDHFRMQQLFQNLISNAVNYIDKKEGFVEISYEVNGTDYIFSIKDNGQGIDVKYQTKIFDLFQSFSDKPKSTGIGLSIVKRIVDYCKGSIWLESALGIGTTFFIKLPKHHGKI